MILPALISVILVGLIMAKSKVQINRLWAGLLILIYVVYISWSLGVAGIVDPVEVS